ncbi:hypothetical protein GOODEAATRI_022518, partial [Goodea atripinnis]
VIQRSSQVHWIKVGQLMLLNRSQLLTAICIATHMEYLSAKSHLNVCQKYHKS